MYRHINLNCVYEEGWELCHASELYWQLHRVTDWLFSSGCPLRSMRQESWSSLLPSMDTL